MKINFGSPFKGTLPKLSRSLLPEGFGVNADNCKLFSGEIRAYGGTSLIKSPNPGAAPPNEILSIYLYDDAYWLNWIEHVRAAPGPIADDTRKRLYWMGDGLIRRRGISTRSPTLGTRRARSQMDPTNSVSQPQPLFPPSSKPLQEARPSLRIAPTSTRMFQPGGKNRLLRLLRLLPISRSIRPSR